MIHKKIIAKAKAVVAKVKAAVAAPKPPVTSTKAPTSTPKPVTATPKPTTTAPKPVTTAPKPTVGVTLKKIFAPTVAAVKERLASPVIGIKSSAPPTTTVKKTVPPVSGPVKPVTVAGSAAPVKTPVVVGKTLSQTMGASMPVFGTPARTALAASAGITSGYTGTAEQNAQIVRFLNKSTGTTTTPAIKLARTPAPVPDLNITPKNTIPPVTEKLPTETADTTEADGLVTGVTEQESQYDAQITAAQQKEDKTRASYESLSGEISKLLGTSGGEGAATLAAESRAGVPKLQAELATATGKVKTGLAEYNQMKSDFDAVSLSNRNKPITMDSIIGNEAAIDFARMQTLNRKASDVGLLEASAQALSGRLDAAQETADRAVELKYKDIKANINIKVQQLSLIRDSLTSKEKITAGLLERQYNAQERETNNQIAKEKSIQSIMLEVAKNGGDAGKISSAGTIEQAILMAGSSLSKSNIEFQKVGEQLLRIDKLTGKVLNSYGSATAPDYTTTKNALQTIYGGNIVNQVADVIKNSGFKPNQDTTNAINVITGLQALASNNPTGVFAGLAPIRLVPGVWLSQESLRNQADIVAINLKVQQWASGAALTEQQTKDVAQMTPRVGNTDKQVRAKVNALANYMLSQVQGQMAGQGLKYQPEQVDFFSSKLSLNQDPLGITGATGKDSLGLGI